ncbi:MAG TPA: MlaD family protein [Oculatellaceae cyanobacterium]|jgi:phospholipid/cholesterol/gamma-HCH transport system substrate-binding protein
MSIASKQRVSAVKVGVLTLLSLLMLFLVLIWLRGRGLAGGSQYTVEFKDVNGMRAGAIVQVMGVRAGFVDEVTPFRDPKTGRYKVAVKFTLNPSLNIQIPRGSHVSIEQSGIVGDQFLEITPPQLREITLTTFKQPARAIKAGIPVRFLYEQGYMDVGKVEHVQQLQDGNLIRHHLYYRITLPGAEMPDDPLFELAVDKKGQYYLRILPRTPVVAKAPDPNLMFTVEEPLRMKRFIEVQLESAIALKLTNDKITELLSDETIDSLHSTLKNTEILTARANEVLENANALFQSTQNDLHKLVAVSDDLVKNVTQVTDNINDIIGDPKLKGEMTSAAASLRESAAAVRDLLNDPAMKETLLLTRDTSRNASELVNSLRQTVQNSQLDQRAGSIIAKLDTSLSKLNTVLDTVDQATDGQDQTLKGLLEDTRETARNLKEVSKKFTGHFVLFKLLF